ncbi:hypothetical protein NKJ54_32105 [Mesorhizobium sp. M0098]
MSGYWRSNRGKRGKSQHWTKSASATKEIVSGRELRQSRAQRRKAFSRGASHQKAFSHQLDPPVKSIEKSKADMLFENGHLLAYSRLGDSEFDRCL